MSEARELLERLIVELGRRAESVRIIWPTDSTRVCAKQAACNALGDALRAVLAQEPEVDEPEVWSDWIEWKATPNSQCPLPDTVITKIETRDGHGATDEQPASWWQWEHHDEGLDLVRFCYRCQPGGWFVVPDDWVIPSVRSMGCDFDFLSDCCGKHIMRLFSRPKPAKPELPEWCRAHGEAQSGPPRQRWLTPEEIPPELEGTPAWEWWPGVSVPKLGKIERRCGGFMPAHCGGFLYLPIEQPPIPELRPLEEHGE